MIQFLAVMTDSLRLLRNRFLFWLSLGLSAVAAVALFGTYSFTEDGLKFLWFKTWENPLLRTGGTGGRDFIAFIFNGFYVKFWLGWGAMILAVVSTASILPEFLAEGSVELSLSKPISRVTLFLYKVVGALFFVFLQVTIGVGVAWLIAGLKFGMWINPALWAIPLLTLQFFYLYSISALIAVLTRSTLASVIGTVLAWLLIFLIQFSSNQIDNFATQSRTLYEKAKQEMDQIKAGAAKEERSLTPREITKLARLESQVNDQKPNVEMMEPWSKRLGFVKLFIPKTNDVQKIIGNLAKAPVANQFFSLLSVNDHDGFRPQGMDRDEWERLQDAGTEGQKAIRRVDTFQSIGTSVAFSVVCLGVGAFVFRRREF
jgi:ABC-type transport system involved in multi-copper enzyme maturation permease subunit